MMSETGSSRGVAALVEDDARLIAKAEKIRFFPFAPVSGAGCWLTDAAGRKLLDFSSGWAVTNVGYGCTPVADAVDRQLRGGHFAGITSAVLQPANELADVLTRLVPLRSPSRKVWFGHSGSDANECVLRLLPMATGRRRIVSFVGSYHGSTDGAAAISGHTAQARYAGSPMSVKVPYPDAFRPEFGTDAQANEAAILRHLDTYILESVSPRESTAAVIIEAIQSDGGDLFPSAEFLSGLEAICRRDGILLVLDEVKVGMGRTGDWFSFEVAGVHPDVVILGKALGGGLPLSAVVGPAELLDCGTAVVLFSAAGNAVATAAALAAIDHIEKEDLRANAATVGEHLKRRLRSIADRHALVGDVRGRGMIIGMELVTDPAKKPAPIETAKVVWRAADLGLIVFYVGLRSNVIEITPPLPLSIDEADIGANILERAISDVEAGWDPGPEFASYAGW
jgi:4-aminobutyrate aminotransferase